jgi:hypothetical protein
LIKIANRKKEIRTSRLDQYYSENVGELAGAASRGQTGRQPSGFAAEQATEFARQHFAGFCFEERHSTA